MLLPARSATSVRSTPELSQVARGSTSPATSGFFQRMLVIGFFLELSDLYRVVHRVDERAPLAAYGLRGCRRPVQLQLE